MKRFACGLVIAALMMTMLTLPASARDFSDIQGHWGQTAIQQVSDWNLFFGTGENEFSPDMLMTRGMFVTVMARTAQLLEVYRQPTQDVGFSDVSEADYFADSVAWARENGVVSGVSETQFAPNEQVTREQMCVIMARFLTEVTNYDWTPDMEQENSFLDGDAISEYAREGVELCVSLGLIVGVPVSGGTEFQPNMPATRAAVAVVLERLVSTVRQLAELPEQSEPEQSNPEQSEPEQPGSSSGGGGGGTQTPEEGEGPTPEERAEEAEMAGYLQIMLDSYHNSDYLLGTEQAVQDCMAILMDCIEDALIQRSDGKFLDRAYIQSAYAAEIEQFRIAYDGLTEDQLNQINNVIVRLADSEQIYFVMDYFGVDYVG